jgi:hypothetical protein
MGQGAEGGCCKRVCEHCHCGRELVLLFLQLLIAMDCIQRSGANSTPAKLGWKKSVFTLMFSGYGLLVLDDFSKSLKMNN